MPFVLTAAWEYGHDRPGHQPVPLSIRAKVVKRYLFEQENNSTFQAVGQYVFGKKITEITSFF